LGQLNEVDSGPRDSGGEGVSIAEETRTQPVLPLPQDPVAEPVTAETRITMIRRRPGWQLIDLGELWRYRELLFFLTWRDVKIRYKQSALGVAWAVIQPLANMAVFTLFLGRLTGISDSEKHYWLFVLAGFLPWTFFSNAIMAASNSVVANERLVTRVYFPRLIIPLSSVGASLVDFAIAGVLLLCVLPFFPPPLRWETLLTPIAMLALLALAIGVGTLLAALTVAYRDVRFLMNFAVQLWMLATPVIYLPVNRLGPHALQILPLNPAFGLIHAFRQMVLGRGLNAYDWYAFGVSFGISVLLLLVGCFYFRRVERGFADII
jgi:lipopolysaccharide transport system permease protein